MNYEELSEVAKSLCEFAKSIFVKFIEAKRNY